MPDVRRVDGIYAKMPDISKYCSMERWLVKSSSLVNVDPLPTGDSCAEQLNPHTGSSCFGYQHDPLTSVRQFKSLPLRTVTIHADTDGPPAQYSTPFCLRLHFTCVGP